jgi:hypothetical protein
LLEEYTTDSENCGMKTKNIVRCPNSGKVSALHYYPVLFTKMKTKPSQVFKLADIILAHQPDKRSQCEVARKDNWVYEKGIVSFGSFGMMLRRNITKAKFNTFELVNKMIHCSWNTLKLHMCQLS